MNTKYAHEEEEMRNGPIYLLNERTCFEPLSSTLWDIDDAQTKTVVSYNEAQILIEFIENSGMVISCDYLKENIWSSRGVIVDNSSVTQAISTLRKLLNDVVRRPSFIKTVPKHGYVFIASINYYQDSVTRVNDSVSAEPNDLETAAAKQGSILTKLTWINSNRFLVLVNIALLIAIFLLR